MVFDNTFLFLLYASTLVFVKCKWTQSVKLYRMLMCLAWCLILNVKELPALSQDIDSKY